ASADLTVRAREGGGGTGRGLELLTVLFDARRPLDVTAIARAMRSTRGAAHRQLRELEALGFVDRDPEGLWCLPPGGMMTAAATEPRAERLLRAELARVRREGYLTAVGDPMPDLASLSVPVFGASGIVGAITVLGPAGRWGVEPMERAAGPVRIDCATLSAA